MFNYSTTLSFPSSDLSDMYTLIIIMLTVALLLALSLSLSLSPIRVLEIPDRDLLMPFYSSSSLQKFVVTFSVSFSARGSFVKQIISVPSTPAQRVKPSTEQFSRQAVIHEEVFQRFHQNFLRTVVSILIVFS